MSREELEWKQERAHEIKGMISDTKFKFPMIVSQNLPTFLVIDHTQNCNI